MENVENQQTDANGHGQVIVERWEEKGGGCCWLPLDVCGKPTDVENRVASVALLPCMPARAANPASHRYTVPVVPYGTVPNNKGKRNIPIPWVARKSK